MGSRNPLYNFVLRVSSRVQIFHLTAICATFLPRGHQAASENAHAPLAAKSTKKPAPESAGLKHAAIKPDQRL
jgi:hypothetical protein